MRHNQDFLKAFIFNQLQRSQGFPKTHFRIPEHAVFFLENFLGLLNSCLLLRTQDDRFFNDCLIRRDIEIVMSFFDGFNGLLCRFQISLKPLCAF